LYVLHLDGAKPEAVEPTVNFGARGTSGFFDTSAAEQIGGQSEMIGVLHKIFTLLVLAFGVIHTAGTFFFYDALSEGAVWFAGAGLGGIFVALLNMGLWPSNASALSRRLAAGANFLFFFWLVAGVSAVPGPFRVLVAGAGAGMVITAPLLGRSAKRRDEADPA
jgi:hypothetical protein